MAPRQALHDILKGILGSDYVYFQPPENVSLKYPCIIYHRDSARGLPADNKTYRYTKRYLVTVVDRNPDSAIPDEVAKLPMCTYNRYFAADNLNHDVFNLFF